MVNTGYETLRWPTNLDRAAIVERLIRVRAAAEAAGLSDLAARFADVETLNAHDLGTHVIAALTWIQEKPEHPQITAQLAMVAMNLKNLKE